MSNLLVNGKITSTGGGEINGTLTRKSLNNKDFIISTQIDLTTTPTTNLYRYDDYLDKNNQRIGVIGACQQTNNWYGVYLQADNNGSLRVLSDGTNSKATFNNYEIDTINSIGDNYIRYNNGLQICWGIKASEGTVNDHTTTITYPQPFKSGTIPAVDAIVYRTSFHSDTHYKHQVTSITNANFKYSDWMIRETADKISWIALGKWK